MDPEVRRDALRHTDDPVGTCWATWEMGNRVSLEDEDVRCLVELLSRVEDAEVDLTRTILWALGRRSDRVPVARITELAKRHPSAEVRRSALRTLAGARGTEPAVKDTIGAIARVDDSEEVRSEAIVLYALLAPADEVLDAAVEGLGREREPALRRRWVEALGFDRSPRSRRLLERFLHDSGEDVTVRAAAAENLAALDPRLRLRIEEDVRIPPEIRERVSRCAHVP